MVLHIDREALDRIRGHGAQTYPEECCGALIGHEEGDDRDDPERVAAHVVEVRPLTNTKQGERERRYIIDPLSVWNLEEELEPTGRRIIGYYHSHPDHPARPSEFDRTHAWPGLSYVVVAVAKGRPEALTSWRLTADGSVFREEPIHLAPLITEQE